MNKYNDSVVAKGEVRRLAHILLVDEKPLYREGVKLACLRLNIPYKFYEATSIKKMVEVIEKDIPIDLAVIDHSLMTAQNSKLLESAAKKGNVKCLYLADTISQAVVLSSKEAAGVGIASKRNPLEQISATVHDVLSGGEVWPHYYPETRKDTVDSAQFSQRQNEIYGMVRRGLSTKSIAYELGLTTSTVQHHISRILKLNNVRNRAQLVCIGAH